MWCIDIDAVDVRLKKTRSKSAKTAKKLKKKQKKPVTKPVKLGTNLVDVVYR